MVYGKFHLHWRNIRMIPVTEKFNTAIKQKSRQIFWTGKILLKDEMVVEFDDKHILLDSGSITHSC